MADNTKNPRNSSSTLFRQLTRLFSGPIVNYRKQVPRQLKRRQLDKYRFRSASGQNFKKAEYSPYDKLGANFYANQNRADRYVDFDQMEYTPEIASALDIYADEMTTATSLRPMMDIKCDNDEIKSVLETLYHNILNIEFNLFGWCRTMCKYGDFFLYLDIDDETGVKHAVGLPSHEVERLEAEDKTNPNYVQFQWNTGGITFENWQIAHFRILGNDKYAPYGTSALEAARRIWRQLTLLEDAVMAYRIVRSPERRVFYVDVGNIAPEDVEQYVQKVMTQMKRNQLVDADTGRVDLRYNPMSIEEDYYIPVRGNSSSRIETLPGGSYTGDIDDIKYLRDKLFSALKVPASYLSRSEGGDEDKTTLAQKDIRFARTVQRLQRVVTAELEKVGLIHLFTLGYRGDDLLGFKLLLNNPSQIAELQELEHWRTKFDVAAATPEGFFSRQWIQERIFGLSEESILKVQRELFYDKKLDANLEKAFAEESAAMGAGPDGGLGGPGGGAPPPMGGPPMGGPPMGGPADMAPEDAAAAAEAPPEEPGPLLAAPPEGGGEAPAGAAPPEGAPPAKRDDGSYLTPRARGKWYQPVDLDRRQAGARRRSYATIDGYKDLKSLANGITEHLESTYSKQENKLLRETREVQELIQLMEKKNNEIQTQ